MNYVEKYSRNKTINYDHQTSMYVILHYKVCHPEPYLWQSDSATDADFNWFLLPLDRGAYHSTQGTCLEEETWLTAKY